MSEKTYDVILAGGGLMSCATAYYLLKEDPNLKVALIEMDPTFEKNSTVLSDGNTRLQFNIKENIQMSQYALEKLETFAEDMAVGETKPDVGFRQEGNLFLTDAENLANAKAGFENQKSLGAEVEWWEPEKIGERFPLLDVSQIVGGAFGKLDGTMDPHAVLIAFKNKAVALGAEFIEAEVVEVLHDGNAVSGVKLASGEEMHASIVVNGAGAWGTELAKTAGIELPMKPVMRTVYVFDTNDDLDVIYPLIVFPTGTYLHHEHGNHFMAAKSTADDPTGFDFSWNRDKFMDVIWEELVEYIPSFDQLKLTSGWAGLYAVNTFDGNAILGEWPTMKGFMMANGFSGHGFQQCHAVGRYLAELIRGTAPVLDLSIFSPQRILDNKPVFEGVGKLV